MVSENEALSAGLWRPACRWWMSSETKLLRPLHPRAPLLRVGIPSVMPQWIFENVCVYENMHVDESSLSLSLSAHMCSDLVCVCPAWMNLGESKALSVECEGCYINTLPTVPTYSRTHCWRQPHTALADILYKNGENGASGENQKPRAALSDCVWVEVVLFLASFDLWLLTLPPKGTVRRCCGHSLCLYDLTI